MSRRDRNYAASQREPLAYWLACVLGMLLGFASFAIPLILIAHPVPMKNLILSALGLLGIATLAAAWVRKG
jgi:hypothetical protein